MTRDEWRFQMMVLTHVETDAEHYNAALHTIEAWDVGQRMKISHLEAENARLMARLAYQDKWLSNGIYYTNKEADELFAKHRNEVSQLKDELVKAVSERDELRELYDAGKAAWDPVYQIVLDERDQLKAELTKLKEWQQIILGTGTDQEAVIRMAATKYTEVAVQSWREEVSKLKAELADSERKLRDLCFAHGPALIKIHDLEKTIMQSAQREARLRELIQQFINAWENEGHDPNGAAYESIIRQAKEVINEAGT